MNLNLLVIKSFEIHMKIINKLKIEITLDHININNFVVIVLVILLIDMIIILINILLVLDTMGLIVLDTYVERKFQLMLKLMHL